MEDRLDMDAAAAAAQSCDESIIEILTSNQTNGEIDHCLTERNQIQRRKLNIHRLHLPHARPGSTTVFQTLSSVYFSLLSTKSI
jgi:hypothetical protein